MSDPSFPSSPASIPADRTASSSADAALLEAALMEMKKVIVGQDRAYLAWPKHLLWRRSPR
jgi:hypothetical protein